MTTCPDPARPDPMDFGRRMPAGLGINLLVRHVARSAATQTAAFGAQVDYLEEHFAVMHFHGSRWLLHSDWSYRHHPLGRSLAPLDARGQGVELRLYGSDPDRAQALAAVHDLVVLCAATDKEHGLREAYLLDTDGYVWVPSVPLPG